MGKNQSGGTAGVGVVPALAGRPAGAAQEQVGNKRESFQVSEGKFFAASAFGVQANWPNLAFGGRRLKRRASGGWRRAPAGGGVLWCGGNSW